MQKLFFRIKNTSVEFQAFTAVIMKNAVFWMCCRVGIVRIDVSGESVASIFWMERIRELGTRPVLTTPTWRHIPEDGIIQRMHF
jgi:hypothetical protein